MTMMTQANFDYDYDDKSNDDKMTMVDDDDIRMFEVVLGKTFIKWTYDCSTIDCTIL